MDSKTATFYAQNANQLALQYSAGSSEIENRLSTVCARSQKILDVGCGTGRDLAFFLSRGKDAVGLDPCEEMLAVARETLKANGFSARNRLFEGALPHLSQFGNAAFDAVLCSAVLMHLPEEELFDAVFGLRQILRPGGTLLISVPAKRDDVDATSKRDKFGRLFNYLPANRLQLLFERVGFICRDTQQVQDSLKREGITWNIFEFRLEESTERPLHLVESILSRDKKDATYKLALFRALSELAQTQHHIASFTSDGKVKIPIQAIADKWILYYWPIFESEAFICQRTGEKKGARNGVAIRRPLEALINYFQSAGGLSGFHGALNRGSLSDEARTLWHTAQAKFKRVIHEMPVRHAGGGNYSVFQYDKFDKSVCMDAELWRELCLTGSWIQDATVLRWAELTEQLSKGAVKASTVIDCLLTIPDPARNVNEAKGYFSSMTNRFCVWSGAPLNEDRFDIDHAMPFSLWRNNELWNLFPVSHKVNSQKSDKLPTYGMLQRRRDSIIDCWRGVHESLEEQFRRGAQSLLGRDAFVPKNWENRLFSRFVEAFEITAAQRGAPRWEIPGNAEKVEEIGDLKPSFPGIPKNGQVEFVQPGIEAKTQRFDRPLLQYSDIADGAFKTHLPLVGSLAAGGPIHGFLTGSLDDIEDLSWLEIPTRLSGERRFIVEVAGDSMKPTLNVGDFVIFEYHRSPRHEGQVVIANILEFGSDHHGVEAIKRISQDTVSWIFKSDNPAYDDIIISKDNTSFPILGTRVTLFRSWRSGSA
jgi:SAM-dependent methyltransferase/SOS-response transcriptional repressor LexA